MSPSRAALLLQRLDQLGHSLAQRPDALGLLALGSVGIETARLDDWSDLDFFVIVAPGTKQRWLSDPAWLGDPHPVAWRFRNTADGFKLLWADGLFGEMAVFEPAELEVASYAEGRWVFRRDGLPERLRAPAKPRAPAPPGDEEWCAGELLSCLYVGLNRFRRGERLSGLRFVQGHCVDRFLELAERWDPPPPGAPAADPFDRYRRFEARHPGLAPLLAGFAGGYEAVPASALALLAWLEGRRPVPAALAAEIRRLAGGR